MAVLSGPDHAWGLLRRHLEWTQDLPSIVFLGFQSRDDRDDLLERLRLYCDRHGGDFTQLEDDLTNRPDRLLRRWLPASGVTYLALPWADDSRRLQYLAGLNELRIRLASRGQGALVITGPLRLEADAAHLAADLWAVRSLWVGVGEAPPAAVTPEPTGADTDRDDLRDGRLHFPSFSIPASDKKAAQVRKLLRAAARSVHTNLDEARRLSGRAIKAADEGTSSHFAALIAAAELAAQDGDGESLDRYAQRAAAADPDLGQRDWMVWIDPVRVQALAYGRLDTASAVAGKQLHRARDLADTLHTPEALRDLSISLNNVADVAAAENRPDAEAQLRAEALDVATRACAADSSEPCQAWLNHLRSRMKAEEGQW